MSDWGKDTHLIDGVMDLSGGEVEEFNFFEGVYRLIDKALDFVDTGVSSFAQFGNDLEVLEGHCLFFI